LLSPSLTSADVLSQVKQLFLIHQRAQYDLSGGDNPYGLVLDLHAQQVRCRQRGFHVLQHL
jgi:hypothetical protein